jgi:hypothetical protein
MTVTASDAAASPHLTHHGVCSPEPVAWVQQLVLVRAVTSSASSLARRNVGSRHELLSLLDADLRWKAKSRSTNRIV